MASISFMNLLAVLPLLFLTIGAAACSHGHADIIVDDYLSPCASVPDNQTPCIQAAIDAASKGDTLIFSARTYYIVPGYQPGDKRYGLIYKSGLTFLGAGKHKTIFTTQNNLKRYNSSGELWFFNAPQGAENVTFRNMSFNFNGHNNLISGEPINNPAIAAANGSSNIQIIDVDFSDNPGNQTIFINYDNSIGNNISVINSSFSNMGYGLPENNKSKDHSTIYITGNNSLVLGNHFRNSRRGNITAIEIHGSNAFISSNTQVRGGSLLILAATHSDASAVVVDNIASETYGIIFWPSTPEYEINHVLIHANHLTCYKRSCIYARPPDMRATEQTINNITISKNVFREAQEHGGKLTGLSFETRVNGLSIIKNLFVGDSGFDISIPSSTPGNPSASTNISIRLNDFVYRSGKPRNNVPKEISLAFFDVVSKMVKSASNFLN